MVRENLILKNENDIYIFFETIKQLEAQSILDIGMFLKRIGSVSRKAMDCEIPETVRLNGVDLFPEKEFPVWKHVYDTIENGEHFLEKRVKDRYDLTVMLGVDALLPMPVFADIIEEISFYTRFLLVNRILDIWKKEWVNAKIIDLRVEADSYCLVDFGV